MNRFRVYLAVTALAGGFALRADCPEGSRATTEAERQDFMSTMNALRAAVPPAPAGWELQAPNIPYTTGPNSTCKGSKLVAGYDVTYSSTQQQKLNEERDRQRDARIAALQQLSPEEQKQADDLHHQGSQLGYQSIAAQKAGNAEESARLRAEANKYYAQSKAIGQAHLDKVFPQIRAILDADRAVAVEPRVHVHLVVSDAPGSASAYSDRDKTLTLSFGRDSSGRTVRAQVQGDRQLVTAIANLLTSSTLRTVAAR